MTRCPSGREFVFASTTSSPVFRNATFLQALGLERTVTSNASTDVMSDIHKESLHRVPLQAAMQRGGGSVCGYHGARRLQGSKAVIDRRRLSGTDYGGKQAKHVQLPGMPGGLEGGSGLTVD